MHRMLKYSGNHKGWFSDGNKLGAVLCVQVTGHTLGAPHHSFIYSCSCDLQQAPNGP